MCVTLISIDYLAGKSCLVLAKLEKTMRLHCRNNSRDRTRRAGSTTTPFYPAKSLPFRSTGVQNSLSRNEVFNFLKLPSGQIRSEWEWFHWTGLKRTSTAIGFLFFIFDLKYFIRVQSSEPLHAKMNSTSCLFGSRFACAQTAIFSAEPSSKNGEETSIVLWITARE